MTSKKRSNVSCDFLPVISCLIWYLTIVQVAYPDAAPVMLMSESSVTDLNTRLDKDVTVFQFRPSIVVSDCEAFTEV